MKIIKQGHFRILASGKLVIAGWDLETDGRSLGEALKWLIFQAASNSAQFRAISQAFAGGDYEVTDFSSCRAP